MNSDRSLRDVFEAINLPYPHDENQSLVEVGIDSIVFINLIVALQSDLGLVIPDDDLIFSRFETVSLIKAYVDAHAAPRITKPGEHGTPN